MSMVETIGGTEVPSIEAFHWMDYDHLSLTELLSDKEGSFSSSSLAWPS